MWAQAQHIYLSYERETQRKLETILDSTILSPNDPRLCQQPLATAGLGTQPGHTPQGRHSRLRSWSLHPHQKVAFSSHHSPLQAQPKAGHLINDLI